MLSSLMPSPDIFPAENLIKSPLCSVTLTQDTAKRYGFGEADERIFKLAVLSGFEKKSDFDLIFKHFKMQD